MLKAITCTGCGGTLTQTDSNLVCPYCGTVYSDLTDDDKATVSNDSVAESSISEDFDIQAAMLIGYHGAAADVVVPKEVVYIGKYAFKGNLGLQTIRFEGNLKKICIGAFSGCESLTSVILPDSLEDIESMGFYKCVSLTSIKGGKNVKKIQNFAFSGCKSLKNIECFDSLTEVGENAFRGAAISSAVLSRIVSVGARAFADCQDLTSVTLAGSARYLSEDVFLNCPHLVINIDRRSDKKHWSRHWDRKDYAKPTSLFSSYNRHKINKL